MNKVILALALLAASGVVHADDPYVGYIFPAGIQAGTTNRFLLGGQFLRGVKGLRFSGDDALRVLKIEVVPGFPVPTGPQRRHLKTWLDGIAAGKTEEPPLPNDPHLDEWRSNAWWRCLGSLDAGKRALVERNLHMPRNTLQSAPSLRQELLVTVAAEAGAKTGWRTFCAYGWNGISAPRPFAVTAEPHEAEPLYSPPYRPRPASPPADVRTGGRILDGQILPGETDAFSLRLAAGRRYFFRTTARELQPYIGDAVPGFFNPILTLKDAQGETVAVADDASRFRPDPLLTFAPPVDGDYRLEIRDLLFRGRADFVYAIAVGDAAARTAPAADGVVARPGAVSSRTFAIDEPGPRVLEVTARRRGSPLDAVLTLRRESDGAVLAQWDDMTNTVFTGTIPQGECDPVGRYDFAEPGRYVVEITDRTGHGGPDYVWWLDVRRPTPRFEVFSTRSTLPLRCGQPLAVGFKVLRKDGFAGAVTIEVPKDVRAESATIPEGADAVTTRLFYTGRRMLPIQSVGLYARAEVCGRTMRVPVTPCDEYEQAFAWTHLVPAEAFLLRGLPGGPARKKPAKRAE